MGRKIQVLISDDSEQTRENIVAIFNLENDIEVIGEAKNGLQAVEMARELKPDIILMDINMPEMDGIRATEKITEEGIEVSIIMMSIQGEKEYIKKAMSAGARDYVIKPFGVKELVDTVRHVYEKDMIKRRRSIPDSTSEKLQTKVISVFSTKGGVGKTTISTNLAVALSSQLDKKVALLDMNLQFGDVAICLNLYVKNTITEVIKDFSNLEQDPYMIEDYLLDHRSGVRVLAAPLRPENAEYVTAGHVSKIIDSLKGRYDYIIIDTSQGFNDAVITALDMSDTVIYVSTLDLPSIKNTKNGLEVLKTLNYSEGKVKIVVNKANENYGVKNADFKDALNVDIWAVIPEDTASATISVNSGHPLVSHRKASVIAKRISWISQSIANEGKEKSGLISAFKRIV